MAGAPALVVEELVLERRGWHESVTRARAVDGRERRATLLAQACARQISEEQYFHEVNGSFWPPVLCAPYCDQRRFVKFDPDCTWSLEACPARRRASVTPVRVRRRPTLPKQALQGCCGTQEEFQALCAAFAELRVPWCELKAGKARRAPLLDARSSSPAPKAAVQREHAVVASMAAVTSLGRNPVRAQPRRPKRSRCQTRCAPWTEDFYQRFLTRREAVKVFTETLPELSAPARFKNSVPLPLGLLEHEPAARNFAADRKFRRRNGTRGRAGPRPNLLAQRDCTEDLERLNFGETQVLTVEEMRFCGARVVRGDSWSRVRDLFGAASSARVSWFYDGFARDRTSYLSSKARNRLAHASNGNTGATPREGSMAAREYASISEGLSEEERKVAEEILAAALAAPQPGFCKARV